MKRPDRDTITKLEELPNVGRAVAADLRRIGIDRPQQLAGCDPYALFLRLEEISRSRQDPCMLDTFMSIVHFMDTGEALPWWSFTSKRKEITARRGTCSQ